MSSRPPSTADAEEVARLRATLAEIRSRIAEACAVSGRDAADVAMLAVSKTVPPERLVLAMQAGVEEFGENRVQEAAAKIPAVLGARWQMVGHLQSNKAARAVALFESIHSVDSLALAERLDHAARSGGRAPYPIYVQVNVDADPAKAGFAPDELLRDAPRLAALDALELRGLMTVGRLVATPEEARPAFRRLRELSEQVRAAESAFGGGLSMGMSDDFEVAVEEGATVVRLGRALFGERPTG